MRKKSGIILLTIGFTICAIVGIANWEYPKGHSYPTGEYIELYDGRKVVPEYKTLPSPETNPYWVRVAQNSSDFFIIIGFGFVFFGCVRIIDK